MAKSAFEAADSCFNRDEESSASMRNAGKLSSRNTTDKKRGIDRITLAALAQA
jgi:hypothetical protein